MRDPEATVAGRLLELWRQAFENPGLGSHDDFFELGGYSMLAMEIVAQIQEHFGVEISFTDFFETPTVAEIADKIETAMLLSPDTVAAPAVRSSEERSLAEILAEVERLSG